MKRRIYVAGGKQYTIDLATEVAIIKAGSLPQLAIEVESADVTDTVTLKQTLGTVTKDLDDWSEATDQNGDTITMSLVAGDKPVTVNIGNVTRGWQFHLSFTETSGTVKVIAITQ